MKKVFVSGSMSVKELPNEIKKSINKIIEQGFYILVGDADGVDKEVCKYVDTKGYKNLIVYHIDESPRQDINLNFDTKKIKPDEKKRDKENSSSENKSQNDKKFGRKDQAFKDRAMADDCDYGLICWDGKSKGSYENIKYLINKNKEIKIYITLRYKFLATNKTNKQEVLNEVKYIYDENNGYTFDEAFKQIKEDNPGLTEIKTKKDFEKICIDKGIYTIENKEDKNNKTRKIKTPTPKYKDKFIEVTYKGQTIGYKISYELYDEIEKIVTAGKKQPSLDLKS